MASLEVSTLFRIGIAALALLGCLSSAQRRPSHRVLDRELLSAAWALDIDQVRDLLRNGANINADGPVIDRRTGASVRQRSTALVLACESGDLPLVRFLIARHAKLNLTDGDGNTALHQCADEGVVDAAKLLLSHGANPRIRNSFGLTPLDLTERLEQPASKENSDAIHNLLLRYMHSKASRRHGSRTSRRHRPPDPGLPPRSWLR